MEREVEDFIQNLPDVDLLEYTHTKIHLPEAIDFAKAELVRRKLPPDVIKSLDVKLHARIKAQEEQIREIASERLPCKWKIAIFLSGLYFAFPLLFFIPAWLKYRDEGSEQKCKDMCVYAGAGFFIQIIMILLKIPPWNLLWKLF
jgi:hypothetical protein